MHINTIRTFIAIELSAEIKKELEAIESILKSQNAAPAKWVNPESIHLTLQFLGDVASDRVTEIIDVIKSGVVGIPSFQIQLAGLGVFPNPARTQVVWAGLSGNMDRLVQLQRNIEVEMEKQGFPREKRKFSPHLTLARVSNHATPDERKILGTLVTGTPFAGIIVRVDSVNLMESQLARQGALYSRLGSIRLE
ncbi:MAG: 2'-5' RNA ligase [Chloroflexi bacterium RBG_13_46_14]|nr:MAG: 2'-5' RNA ligase [Chloroflexi bacterium RBG_13_46_14]